MTNLEDQIPMLLHEGDKLVFFHVEVSGLFTLLLAEKGGISHSNQKIFFFTGNPPFEFIPIQDTLETRMKKHIITLLFLLPLAYSLAQDKLMITHLTGDFYVFTTYNLYKNTLIPANGLYVVTNDGVIMVDSPWDTTQFQPLLDSIRARHNKNVTLCIATHFHEDRTGGLEYYKKQGIKTFTTKQTDALSRTRGMKRAEFLIQNDTTISVGQYSFQTYHPGHGHTADNIVIWFGKEEILYGGCLIKSTEDTSLGNLADADVNVYAQTLKNVQQKCVNPKHIIPGHNSWSSVRSLEHSIKMAEVLKK
jgi:metallo-beta-lactamase class B